GSLARACGKPICLLSCSLRHGLITMPMYEGQQLEPKGAKCWPTRHSPRIS
ncbi:hypothetical protein TorRG33x02_083960, partial [Trema orientale]